MLIDLQAALVAQELGERLGMELTCELDDPYILVFEKKIGSVGVPDYGCVRLEVAGRKGFEFDRDILGPEWEPYDSTTHELPVVYLRVKYLPYASHYYIYTGDKT